MDGQSVARLVAPYLGDEHYSKSAVKGKNIGVL